MLAVQSGDVGIMRAHMEMLLGWTIFTGTESGDEPSASTPPPPPPLRHCYLYDRTHRQLTWSAQYYVEAGGSLTPP